MTPFEEELKRALARHEPAEDFGSRVMAAIAEAEEAEKRRARIAGLWQWMSWRSVAAFACLLVALVAAGFVYQQHAQRIRGEAAKEQLLAAMRVAGKQLHNAQIRVQRIEFPEVAQ